MRSTKSKPKMNRRIYSTQFNVFFFTFASYFLDEQQQTHTFVSIIIIFNFGFQRRLCANTVIYYCKHLMRLKWTSFRLWIEVYRNAEFESLNNEMLHPVNGTLSYRLSQSLQSFSFYVFPFGNTISYFHSRALINFDEKPCFFSSSFYGVPYTFIDGRKP